MDALDFMVDRDQHMRPLEYDLSENFNALLRYMQDMGILDNVPVGTTSESEIVSISDAYPAPPRALTVYGKSTQAGTPTPDAPVPILSVDELALVLHGVNLFDVDNADFANGQYFNNSGVIYNSPYARLTRAYTPVLGDTSYTLSYCKEDTPQVSCGVMFYESDKAFISGTTFTITAPIGAKSVTFTTPANARYIRFHLSLNSFNIQLEIGSTATAYEPYQGATVLDMLPEGTSLRSLPDGTKDTLALSYLRPSTRAGWAWYSRELVTRCKKYVFTSSETWKAYTYVSGAGYYSTTRFYDRVSHEKLCNMAVSAIRGNEGINTCYFGGGNELNMVGVSGSAPTVADWVALLAETPLEIIYALTTPVTTTLDPIELPTLPAPNATIWCDGGSATPTLILEYVKDASAAIAELSEAIADIVSG